MLYRTKSFLSLSDYDSSRLDSDRLFPVIPSSPNSPHITALSYTPSLPYKEQQESHAGCTKLTITSDMPPSRASIQSRGIHKLPVKRSQLTASSVRYTSPLAPIQKLLPPRARFPRSKPKPDLYRSALKRMTFNALYVGKFHHMALHLAIHTTLSATRELERVVSAYENEQMVGDERVWAPVKRSQM